MTAADDTPDLYKVEANADKALFVTMLVKDIELLPALIDLVDNSVDSARATSPATPESFFIDMQVHKDRFSISDNCGGISLTVARLYAFRFGRPSGYDGTPGSVGQFGVGMKRALFKLGSYFTVASRSESTAFELEVDVTEWVADDSPDWQFRMKSIDTAYNGESGTGTTITVERLHDTVCEDFENPLVLGQLREQIRLKHQAVLNRGMRIELNGERLDGFVPALLDGPGIRPINRAFSIANNGDEVHCRIVAGIAAAAGDDETRDEGNAEAFSGHTDAGWWLFCNGRLLLFRERTSLTGWGDAVAAYHPQYRRFRGYVYLEALDAALLPWNTTKTGVDQDSRVWRKVHSEMKTSLAQVISVLNRLKTERQQASDEDEMPIHYALRTARSTPVPDLGPSSIMVAPALPRPKVKPKPPMTQRIQYDVDINRYRAAAAFFSITTIGEVGRRTFDYFYEREIDD